MGRRPFVDDGHDGVVHGPVSSPANLHDPSRPRLNFDGGTGNSVDVAFVVRPVVADAENGRTARAAAMGIARHAMSHGIALRSKGIHAVEFLDPPGGALAILAYLAAERLATE